MPHPPEAAARGERVEARPWRGPGPPARVLAIRLHALGDTVLTLPYMHALGRALPGVRLDFLTREEVADIPASVELFDRVFRIGGGRDPLGQWVSALGLLPRLWARRYDVVLDLQRSRISRLVRVALAPAAWTEFDRFSPRLAGERTRRTIEAAGLAGSLDVRADLSLRDPDLGLDTLREAGWDGSAPLVVLNPAGAFSGRAWPVDSYARFARLWTEREGDGARVLLLGVPAHGERARALETRLGAGVLNLVGRTSAAEAFALLGRARLVVSEDSGLLHMAWVRGAPTLGLFGASLGFWARPHGSHSAWIRACERADGACGDGLCLAGSPTCLERLAPERVVEEAAALLARWDREPGEPGRIYVDGHAYAPAADP